MIRLNRRVSAIAALAAFLAFPGPAFAQDEAVDSRPALGLMGTLPIYWGEAAGLGDIISPERQPHWARLQMEQDYQLVPIDWLDAEALASLRHLLLAQPRALSPQENVALDAWVRGGGQLLLFADPMLTGESRFAVGDRRRPQDVVLLSPILDHWGLRLEFVEDQPAGLRHVAARGGSIPVRLAGRLALDGTTRDCTLSASDLLAQCDIGAGTALIVADAALLDLHEPDPAAAPALSLLMARAFAKNGDDAGNQHTKQEIPVYQLDRGSPQSRPPPETEGGAR